MSCSARSALRRALAVGFTFLWHAGILGDDLATVDFADQGVGGIRWTSFVVLVLLVPLVGEVLKQVGPILLARRPAFDDMIDGLTFGVAAGAAFAAAETIVVNRGLFSAFGQVESPNAGFWVSLILSAAVVKPIVYGAATGIAVASFSGLGAGYDGFKPGYFRGLAEALVANILFQGGLFFAARVEGTTGAVRRPGLGRADRGRAGRPAALPAPLRGARGRPGGGHDRRRAQGHRPRHGVLPLMRDAAAGRRELLRRLRHLGPGRQQGHPGPQPHRRRRPCRRARSPACGRPRPAWRRRTTRRPRWSSARWWRRSWSAACSARSQRPGPPADEGDDLKPPSETGITIDPASGEDELGRTPAVRLGECRRRRQQGASTAAGSDQIVTVGDDVLMLMPKGFRIVEQEDGFVQVFGYKGYFFAYLTPKKTTLPKLITNNLTGIQNMGVEDLEITQPSRSRSVASRARRP